MQRPMWQDSKNAVQWSVLDLFSVLSLALVAMVLTSWLQDALGPEIYAKRFFDLWFSADQPRVVGNLADAEYWDHRSYIHPLFKLAFYPITYLLIHVGFDSITAAQLLTEISLGLAIPLFYAGLRGLGLPIIAALVISACLFASAAFIHWAAIVETYPFALLSLTMMFAILTCMDTRSKFGWYLGSIFTLAITVTNWSFGLAATFFRLKFRSFVVVTGLTLCTAIALGYFQQAMFKDAKLLLFFDPANLSRESEWMQPTLENSGMLQWDPVANLRSMVFYSAVVPPPEQISRSDSWHNYQAVDNQSVSLTQYSPAATAAAAAWIIMICAGVWGGVIYGAKRQAFLALTTFALGQVGIHLIYGDVTFLYSLNFFFSLVAIAAFGWFSPARLVSLVAALVFLVAGGASNLKQFLAAAEIAHAVIENSPSADGVVIVTAAGDAYKTLPRFRLVADGQTIGTGEIKKAVDTTAGQRFDELGARAPAYLERFVFSVKDVEDVAALEVEFVNDGWAGQGRLGDRNLFVTDVSVSTIELHSDVSLVTTANFDAQSFIPIVPDEDGARITAKWAGLYAGGKLRLERPKNGWTRNELGVPVRHRAGRYITENNITN